MTMYCLTLCAQDLIPCMCVLYSEYVAVKVVRRVRRYVEDALVEVGILDELCEALTHGEPYSCPE
jgi:hypothetical protein